MSGSNRPRASALVIDLIDRDCLEVSAIGSFDALSLRAVTDRLAQLLSCGPIRLRIDFKAAGVVDPLIVNVLRRAKFSLEAAGGAFEIIGTTPAMARTIGLPGRDTTNRPRLARSC